MHAMLSYCIDDIKYRITDNMKIIVILILYFVIENLILLNGYLASRKWGSWVKSRRNRTSTCAVWIVLSRSSSCWHALVILLSTRNFGGECPFSAKDMTIHEAIETLNDFCLGWLQLWLMGFLYIKDSFT